jgi:cation transport ATPase
LTVSAVVNNCKLGNPSGSVAGGRAMKYLVLLFTCAAVKFLGPKQVGSALAVAVVVIIVAAICAVGIGAHTLAELGIEF